MSTRWQDEMSKKKFSLSGFAKKKKQKTIFF